MRRRTLQKLAFSLTIPTQAHQHEDDDCPMCRGGSIQSFLPDAEGNPPAAYPREFLVKEARKVHAVLPPGSAEAAFMSMGVNRGGRMVSASFTVDREGAIHWNFDGKRTFVTRLDAKPETN